MNLRRGHMSEGTFSDVTAHFTQTPFSATNATVWMDTVRDYKNLT